MKKCFFGIDIGTQGVRVILVDQDGIVIASKAKSFTLEENFREEQSPEIWWDDCYQLISAIMSGLSSDFDRTSIVAAAVTSTSGTVIPLGMDNVPIHDAIMYSDPRSIEQGKRMNELASQYVPHGYTGFNASSGISKMLWYMDTFPDRVDDISLWAHASDYIVGKLSGNYRHTDFTNVLKSGYDLDSLRWPDYLFEQTGLRRKWMQEVVPSGSVVGQLRQELAAGWGMPAIAIVVGITDGCASQVASGAVRPGDWNTTIGTTLVIKGVTLSPVVDPLGRLYNHRHPEGYWMPGGASNTGADWISLDFGTDLEELSLAADALIPTGLVAWPLKQQGERYPIMAPQARAIIPETDSISQRYAANLEGVAFIERLAYEMITELSGEQLDVVYTAGGGSNSDVWLRIRSAVLGVPIYKCKEASGALGAAIMAASQTWYGSLTEAAKAMTSVEKRVIPDKILVEAYNKQYQLFKDKLKALKYI
ncbi:FGGY-family carbohydrate kinase [Sphingobacterium faecale]|uniref:FGGY-family carbohydrate kinase n=1 Tax=Sphingobacterium faecale TaxID=2803775 RepID=A0ABS1R6W9_9SPHI|nr:FGGY-family carbohydrate kinase [Sphingobacterium faecale]MBL1410449.1 FGGY-family carbohydrate kinase [Sphingobacterium faecale]